MFSNLLNYFLKKINKPHLYNEINLWWYSSVEVFGQKLEKRIAWFSTTFDKLTFNKFNISNKKWEFDYIVRRTWYMVIFCIVYIIFFILFVAYGSVF